MDAPLALYRRYRPDTFDEVIGQDHVTTPLRHALTNNRVHHAYLFSGPRGCGKTTSARILARALNCEQGPTSEPCGTCDSCVSLARGGAGSLDVIEIDAASHGGVDDARDLRERAFFAPVSSRYKVYIIDEAHMVTTQGYNDLLKLVEEPPPHHKFIIPTTDPDKVIGTIKSRTHHYPFRLVPPKTLGDYLGSVCGQEQVTVDPAVLPLVVRAGAGSVRDSLSVLDQLIGGSGADGVTYAMATALLGYTPQSLLDEVVDAFAAGDAASVFAVVDKVIETGQDPRRFGEDLLQRLRDLLILAAVPDAVSKGIVEAPDDQAERLSAQADRFGRAELTRAADVVNDGLTEMRGATAPRLLLELICAHVLLPGADDTLQGTHARLDRLERRLTIGGPVSAGTPSGGSADRPGQAAASRSSAEPVGSASGPATSAEPVSDPPDGSAEPSGAGSPSDPREAPGAGSTHAPTVGDGPTASPQSPAGGDLPAAESPTGGQQISLSDVRRLWPDVLDVLAGFSRTTWSLVSHNANVVAAEDGVLTLGFKTDGIRRTFGSRDSHQTYVRQALIDRIGVDWRIEAIVDPSAAGQPSAGSGPVPRVPRSVAAPAAPTAPPPVAPGSDQDTAGRPGPPAAGPAETSVEAQFVPPPPSGGAESSAERHDRVSAAGAEGAGGEPSGGPPDWAQPGPDSPPDENDGADPNDDDLDEAALGHDELLARELGAQVIEEIPRE